MRISTATHQSLVTVEDEREDAGGLQRTNQCRRLARAYRSGRLICGWVQVTDQR